MSDKITAIIDSIAELTVIELSQLKTAFEERFDVKAAAPMAVGMVAAPAAGGAAAAEEAGPTNYDVILKEIGANKIAVIKVVKEVAGLGLKEAKDVVDGAPKAVKNNLPEAEAKKLKEQLEAAGAVVELKGV